MKFLSKASVLSLATIASTMLGTVPAFAETNLSATQTNVETPLSWVGEAPSEKFEVMDRTNHYFAPTDLEIQNSFLNKANGKDNDLHIKYIKDGGQTVSRKVGTVKSFELGIAQISGTVQDGRTTPAGWSITHQATARATTSGGAVKHMRAKEILYGVYFSTDNVGGMKADVFRNGRDPEAANSNRAGGVVNATIMAFDTSSGVNNFISVKDATSAGAGHELNGQGTTKFNDRAGLDHRAGKIEFTFVNPDDKLENGDTLTYTTTWTLNAAPVGTSV